MNLKSNNDGTYTCQECLFVFGQGMMSEMGDGFNEYHTKLHSIVMTNKVGNLPDSFKDIAQGE